MALGKLGAVGRKDERHVPERGELESEGVVDEDLAQGVGEMLLGAEVVHGEAAVSSFSGLVGRGTREQLAGSQE